MAKKSKAVQANGTIGVEIAIDSMLARADWFKTMAQLYRRYASDVTSDIARDSGLSRKALKRHYRAVAHKAESRAMRYSQKADRLIGQL